MRCTKGCLAIVKSDDRIPPSWHRRTVICVREATDGQLSEHNVPLQETGGRRAWWISDAHGELLDQPIFQVLELGPFQIPRFSHIKSKEVACLEEFLIPLTPPGRLDEEPAPPVATPIPIPELTH